MTVADRFVKPSGPISTGGGKLRNQRIVIERPGGAERLKLVSEEMPEPIGRQVRVKVLAAGVAYGDVYLRGGFVPFTKFPATPGYDFVGVVDGIGRDVSSLRPGDVVAGLPMIGGYSQYVDTDQDQLVPVPTGLDPAEAVSVVLNYTTAYQLLNHSARLQRGDSVLVHAAAGGVGTALVQLAKRSGIEVYGTASPSKLRLVRELGAIPIDYTACDFVAEVRRMKPAGVDAVFDAIGGTHWFRSNAALRKGGTLVGYGMTAAVQGGGSAARSILRTLAIMAWLKLVPNSKRFIFGTIQAKPNNLPEQTKGEIGEMLRLLHADQIAPIVAARLPLKDASHAHELLESSKSRGKIVLINE